MMLCSRDAECNVNQLGDTSFTYMYYLRTLRTNHVKSSFSPHFNCNLKVSFRLFFERTKTKTTFLKSSCRDQFLCTFFLLCIQLLPKSLPTPSVVNIYVDNGKVYWRMSKILDHQVLATGLSSDLA